MVLKSRDYVFKMSIFSKLSIVLYSIRWYMYMFILKKLNLRAAVVANRSIIESSMLGVSDRWICSIIRHSRRFSSIEARSAVVCNVNVVKWNKLCLPYNFS